MQVQKNMNSVIHHFMRNSSLTLDPLLAFVPHHHFFHSQLYCDQAGLPASPLLIMQYFYPFLVQESSALSSASPTPKPSTVPGESSFLPARPIWFPLEFKTWATDRFLRHLAPLSSRSSTGEKIHAAGASAQPSPCQDSRRRQHNAVESGHTLHGSARNGTRRTRRNLRMASSVHLEISAARIGDVTAEIQTRVPSNKLQCVGPTVFSHFEGKK